MSSQDVSVFWDIETTLISASVSASTPTFEVVAKLRTALETYGPLRSIRAYWDYTNCPLVASTNKLRSELSSSGVILIDCPGEGRKAAATKKMLIDIILHAWDHPSPHTFVVVTSDRDVAYALSILRMRKYRVILMSSTGSHSDLTSQASINLDWSQGILGLTEETLQNKSASDSTSASHTANQPAAPSSAATFQDMPAPTSQFIPNTLGGYDSQGEMPEPHMRGRRQSVFSKPFDANYSVFGDFDTTYMTPPKTMASLGLGDGPLFPRSQSSSKLKNVRSGSAPPHILDMDGPTKRGYLPPRRGSDFASVPSMNLKGKEREFPVFEPEEIAPQHPFGVKPRPSWISSTFEPFNEVEQPRKAPLSNSKAKRKDSMVSISSLETVNSDFSLLERSEKHTTAPTSAEHDEKFTNSDRKQTFLPLTEEPTSVGMTAGVESRASSRRSSSSGLKESVVSQPAAETSTPSIAKRTSEFTKVTPVASPVPKPNPPTTVAAFSPAPAARPTAITDTTPKFVPLATQPAPAVASTSTAKLSQAAPSTIPAASPVPSPNPPKIVPATSSNVAARPVVPLPARATVGSTPTFVPFTPQPAPTAVTSSTPKLPDAALLSTWMPLIMTLRENSGVVVYSTLPPLLLKSYPSAYSRAGKNKYGKYIDEAVSSGIVRVVKGLRGQEVRLCSAYA